MHEHWCFAPKKERGSLAPRPSQLDLACVMRPAFTIVLVRKNSAFSRSPRERSTNLGLCLRHFDHQRRMIVDRISAFEPGLVFNCARFQPIMAVVLTKLTIDKLGRIVLPKLVREKLQLSAGDELELESLDDLITLRPLRGTGQVRKKTRCLGLQFRRAAFGCHCP